MDPSSVKDYMGVPVLVQLRFPLAGVTVSRKGKLPYADDPEKNQWVTEPFMEGGSPSATQLVAFAVLYPVTDGVASTLEMRWSSIPVPPPPGAGLMGQVVTLATLIDSRDIVAITRVVAVPEAPPC